MIGKDSCDTTNELPCQDHHLLSDDLSPASMYHREGEEIVFFLKRIVIWETFFESLTQLCI